MNDLARSWLATSSEASAAVTRVLSSGSYILGPEVAAFEDELSAFIGSTHTIGVASGTDALALALQACGCQPGDEVIVAANAGGYTSVAAMSLGCTIALADIDPRTGLATAETLVDTIGPRTRAIVVTHLFGNVADATAIRNLCDERGIAMVEDCAQALGGRDGEARVGSIGHAAAFSFYPTKNLGGFGDGGAVTTSDAGIARTARSLRQYGWGTRYDIHLPGGRNSRLDEVQAAVLRVGLPMVDDLNALRVKTARRYAAVAEIHGSPMVTGASPSTVAHLAVLRVEDRARVRERMGRLGIATDVHYPILDHRQRGLSAAVRATPIPVSEQFASEILSIPCFTGLREDEVGRVESALDAALQGWM